LESKRDAKARAKRNGFKQSSVIKSDNRGYFIVPRGVETNVGKKAYANCRTKGKDKATCAKISHVLNRKGSK